jgi:type IV secretory pathway component VirB8
MKINKKKELIESYNFDTSRNFAEQEIYPADNDNKKTIFILKSIAFISVILIGLGIAGLMLASIN